MRREDELISRLSDRLDEEIKSLPKDGKDHEFIIKIKGDHGNINLGKQTFEIHSGGKQTPPHGSAMARECPQCGNIAWRFTQLCMHCEYDLRLHDEIEEEQERKRQKDLEDLRMLKIFGGCVFIAVFSFLVKDYLPEPLQGWSLGITLATGFLAFCIMQSPNK
ncbi:hypothetical protein PSCICO_07920 [Pseudomonas cichorii]|uniref:hypothetical protein n=1 Tax=Pseudomonas cichorii TaxID=36746 RepID=UPI00191028E9|nr:hypothetical protein [Pseudomonas cichorii]GFM85393.1 hypothetical protein PSCICO_07920 [Pseudomonas cichorii]